MASVEELLGGEPQANEDIVAPAPMPVQVSCVIKPEVATIDSSRIALPEPYPFDAVIGMDQLPAVEDGPLSTPVVSLIVQPVGKPEALKELGFPLAVT